MDFSFPLDEVIFIKGDFSFMFSERLHVIFPLWCFYIESLAQRFRTSAERPYVAPEPQVADPDPAGTTRTFLFW